MINLTAVLHYVENMFLFSPNSLIYSIKYKKADIQYKKKEPMILLIEQKENKKSCKR